MNDDGSEQWKTEEEEGEPLPPLLVRLLGIWTEYIKADKKDVQALAVALNKYFRSLELEPSTYVRFADGEDTDWVARQRMPGPPVNVKVFLQSVLIIFDIRQEEMLLLDCSGEPEIELDYDNAFHMPFEHITAALFKAAALNAAGVD